MGNDQHGIDLQCKACGRFGESKGWLGGRRLSTAKRSVIPGGSFLVRERNEAQGYRVDLYCTAWNRQRDFVVRGIAAENQPPGLIRPRTIITGSRGGYIVSDIILAALDDAVFPIIACRVRSLASAELRRKRQGN